MFFKSTLKEEARKRGISVSALKRQFKFEETRKKIKKAESQLQREISGPGWNPRAGNKKKHRPEVD